MSYSVDTNILIYASDTKSPYYKKAKAFLLSCLQSKELCYLTWDTIYSFIRIATHPSIFKIPLSPEKAWQNIQTLKTHPAIRFIAADDKSWDVYESLQKEIPIRGNLVPDAVIASILEANNIKKIYTHDRDFFKFPFLKPVDPVR